MKSVKVLTKVDLGSGQYKVCDFPTQTPLRRSIDDYTSRLMLRSLERRENQDFEVRIGQHSSLMKLRTKPTQIGKIALTIIGTSQQQPPIQCFTERKPEKKASRVNLLRSTSSHFSQRLTRNMQIAQLCNQQQDPYLSANSSKIKLLHSSPRNKNIFLVLRTDFLLDQSNFWCEQRPEDSAVRTWRQLVNVANIVWIVRKPATYQKLVEYCERMILPLDAVYLLEPKRNKLTVTINLRPLKTDLLESDSQKIIFFGFIKQSQKITSFQLLQNRLPLIQHKFICVHLIQSNASATSVFYNVLDILRKQPTQRLELDNFWEQYVKSKSNETKIQRRSFSRLGQRFKITRKSQLKEYDNQLSTLDRIQTLKKEWTSWILKMKALSMKTSNIEGESVPFIVGDMLKRNYTLLHKFYRREANCQRRNRCISSSQGQQNLSVKNSEQIIKIGYTIPVFIWNF